jgi:hypothetical protein|tara:strand:- start:353 stop:598 length:246 start_codon:yes stop_codon:yes gene_type:complete
MVYFVKRILDRLGIGNIVRVREKKNRYGLSWGWNRKVKILGFKIPALSSISLHTGKGSVYAFLPFWNMKSIFDYKGYVQIT